MLNVGPVLVMGVAGCGKSTVGEALAAALGSPFLEGDSLHPPRNIALMSSGRPLEDADRAAWLDDIAAHIARSSDETGIVVACSALKRSYRDVLRRPKHGGFFLHLDGPHAVLARRMAERTGHFMPPAMLDSQFAILDPLANDEAGMTVSVETPVADIVKLAVAALSRRER